MQLLNKLTYKKPDPFRDATIFIIVCEGSSREPDYFEFFDQITSKIKVKAIPSKNGQSSPNFMIENASKAIQTFNSDEGDYVLWIVVDVDKWIEHGHLYELHREVRSRSWSIAISNPCFEVWLARHITPLSPETDKSKCKNWKSFIPTVLNGGFNSDFHPTLIKDAILNSKADYEEEGFIPKTGCTQLFRLGEEIYKLVKEELQKYEQ